MSTGSQPDEAELVVPRSRCRLVVLVNEVGGRWSRSTGLLEASRPGHVVDRRVRVHGCSGSFLVKAVLMARPRLQEVEGDFRSVL